MKYEERYTPEQRENHKLWLAQLRHPDAGKFERALESSDNPNRRCCLGHACHALGIKMRPLKNCSFTDYDGEHQVLSKSVQLMLGIDSLGSFKKRIPIDETRLTGNRHGIGDMNDLTDINDCSDYLPHEIADIIEAQFAADNFEEIK